MAELAPGKGVMFDLTQESLGFLRVAIEDAWNAAGEPDEPGNLDELVDSGDALKFLQNIAGSAAGWKKAKDKFGTKLYKEIAWNDGTYRITVVITSRGDLKIDFRNWWTPDA